MYDFEKKFNPEWLDPKKYKWIEVKCNRPKKNPLFSPVRIDRREYRYTTCDFPRNSDGEACARIALRGNHRCTCHGGWITGPPKNNKNAYKTGHFTAEKQQKRAEIRTFIEECELFICTYK